MNATAARLLTGLLALSLTTATAAEETARITYGGQRIDLHYDSRYTAAEREVLHRWLVQVADAIRTVYGELPEDRFQVNIETSRQNSGPVPWGQVERDDPTTITLQIRPEYGYDALLADWTAFHELSHLFLPYQGYGDVWISEGLATYYQNITRTRSGHMTEVQMWQDIADGLAHASEQPNSHTTLSELGNQRREHKRFMRIYWSGVLYWLSADVELRSQGKGTLDEALHRLKACCATHSMSAAQIAYRLDALMDTHLFLPKYREYSQSTALPDYTTLLGGLGVRQNGANAEVVLVDGALAEIRRQIAGQGR